jgi:hypothetical protein
VTFASAESERNVTVENISPIIDLRAATVENATATDFVSLAIDTEDKQDSQPKISHPCPSSDSIVDYAKRAVVQFGVRLEEFSDCLGELQEVECRQLRALEIVGGWATPWNCRRPRALDYPCLLRYPSNAV